MRIDKMLASCGAGTRNEIKKMIRQKRVEVNGVIVTDAGMHADPEKDEITLDGEPVVYSEFAYYMLNKPAGYVSSTEGSGTVMELVRENDRGLFPCGRLDRDTEGLLLITNDGRLAHRLLSPKHHVEKEYSVSLRDPVGEDAVRRIEEGIVIDGGEKCLPASVRLTDEKHCYLVIQEGKYHQIKRMFQAVGNEVTHLKRVRMKGLVLDASLAPGEYRKLSPEELSDLRKHDREQQGA